MGRGLRAKKHRIKENKWSSHISLRNIKLCLGRKEKTTFQKGSMKSFSGEGEDRGTRRGEMAGIGHLTSSAL